MQQPQLARTAKDLRYGGGALPPDELAAALDDLARADPDLRIDGTRAEDGTIAASLVWGPSRGPREAVGVCRSRS